MNRSAPGKLASRPRLQVKTPGRMPYLPALRLQHELVELRIQDRIDDQLLLLEHDPVLTVGRGAEVSELASSPFPKVEIERGGAVTYHGPGQLVGYPILKLPPDRRDLHRYLRGLESVLIRVVRELGLPAGRRAPLTGVWVGDRKIASIGVAVRRWVTYHGFALNVETDLSVYRTFRPCGLPGEVMSSLSELGLSPDPLELIELVVRAVAEEFEREATR